LVNISDVVDEIFVTGLFGAWLMHWLVILDWCMVNALIGDIGLVHS